MSSSSDMMTRIRKLAPAIFALALFCFFMPFVTVSCTSPGSPSTQLATLNGVEMITGKDVNVGNLTGGLSAGSTSNSSQTGHIAGQLGAGIALLSLLVGLVGGLVLRGRIGTLVAAGAGALAFLGLLWAKFAFDNYVAHPETSNTGTSSSPINLSSVQVTADYQFGFWVALLLSLIAAGAYGYFATQTNAAIETAATPFYPPPSRGGGDLAPPSS